MSNTPNHPTTMGGMTIDPSDGFTSDPSRDKESGTVDGGNIGGSIGSDKNGNDASSSKAKNQSAASICVTSDEINFLIYRYLQESGFVHTAFTFAYESLLGRSPVRNVDVPPGALISFLQKGLQYLGIEESLNEDGSDRRKRRRVNGTGGVTNPGSPEEAKEEFTLLSRNACKALGRRDPPIRLNIPPAAAAAAIKAKLEVDAERKAKEEKAKKQAKEKAQAAQKQQGQEKTPGPSSSGPSYYVSTAQQAKGQLSNPQIDLSNISGQSHSHVQGTLPQQAQSSQQSLVQPDGMSLSMQQHSQQSRANSSKQQQPVTSSGPAPSPAVSGMKQSLRLHPQNTASAAAAAAAAAMSQLRRQGDKNPTSTVPTPTTAGGAAAAFAAAAQQAAAQQLLSQTAGRGAGGHALPAPGHLPIANGPKSSNKNTGRHTKTSKTKNKSRGASSSSSVPPAASAPSNSSSNVSNAPGPATNNNNNNPSSSKQQQQQQQAPSQQPLAALHQQYQQAINAAPRPSSTPAAAANAWSLLDEAAARIEAKNALASRQQPSSSGTGKDDVGQQARQDPRQDHQQQQQPSKALPHPSRAMIHPGNGIPGNILSIINEQIQNQQAAVAAAAAQQQQHAPGPSRPSSRNIPSSSHPHLTTKLPLNPLDNTNLGNSSIPHSSSPAPPPIMDDSDAATLAPLSSILELNKHTSEVFMCAWNPIRTDLIATGSGDASARIWQMGGEDARGGCTSSRLLQHGNPSDRNKDVTTLEWSADGELLATGSYDGVARVWNRGGNLLHTLRSHRGPIFSLKWNRRGDFLLSGSYDKTTIVWDVSGEMGYVKQQFNHHFAPALDVDWKDDTTFASCSTDKTVHICVVGKDHPIQTYTGHADEVNAVKWDPSGTLLASCSDDCTAKVWDVSSGRNQPLHDFKSHQQEIYTVKWSPTGQGSKNPSKPLMLATASFDGSVRLWNVQNGTCIRVLSRHRDSVYSVSFSPSGDYLASGSLAGQLYVWNMADGRVVKSFRGKGDIFEVAWNVEETRVAACFSSNVVSVIDFKK